MNTQATITSLIAAKQKIQLVIYMAGHTVQLLRPEPLWCRYFTKEISTCSLVLFKTKGTRQ